MYVLELYCAFSNGSRRRLNYPKDPAFLKKFGPRGVIRSKSDGKGGQTIEDTGPLTKKRMETIEEETLAAAKDFVTRQKNAGD